LRAAHAPAYRDPGGMWLPGQMGAFAPRLKAAGLALPASALGDLHGDPLGAVVSLDGCTGSFVSPDGLIITNHHCVTDALQYLSSPGHDLVESGFVARARADEKWIGPTGRVFVTESMKDVTADVRAGLDEIADDVARFKALQAREKQLIATCEAVGPNVRCEVASMFGGGQYVLITRLEIKDVRLVAAPPDSVGNFGGEIDNWRWPRHAGDFGIYRAYIGLDQLPAEHAPSNVPYHPRWYLRIAKEPLEPGDLVFVAGYPYTTYRLRTVDEVEQAVDWSYPRRIQLCEDYLGLLDKLGKRDEDVRLKALPLVRDLANTLTYTKGALEGLTRGGAAADRQALEQKLKAWIQANPERRATYRGLFQRLDAIFAAKKRTRDADAALREMTWFPSLLGDALSIVRNAENRPKPDAEREPGFQARDQEQLDDAARVLGKRYSRKLDAALLTEAAERSAKLPGRVARPLLRPLIGGAKPTDANIEAAVARVYAQTKLENENVRMHWLEAASLAKLKKSADPMIRLALALRPLQRAAERHSHAYDGAMLVERPRYVAALRAESNEPLAPDANRTLRITFGSVVGYRPKPDAAMYAPFTTVSGVVKKTTGKPPFDTPQDLLDAARAHRFGRYVDRRLGQVPVDFLSDVDITGGNSGSPTLNARGRLVGLAFDGNYEAMASDWLFMPHITRAIHVDIRYVLWILDAVDHDARVLKELGVTPEFPSR
jgi:Peptidase S46